MLSRTIYKVIQKGVKVVLNISDTGVIKLTRGDTARFSVGILNEISDSAYSISNNDRLTLTVKKKVKDEDALIQKTITGATLFHIKPEDTSSLSFGKYVYDVQLTTSDGDVYTIVGPTTFELLAEVTY